MSTITAFNDMMEQFIEELIQTFPGEPYMKKYRVAFDVMRKANVRKCMEGFIERVSPYSKQLMAKDASFFLDDPDVFQDFTLNKVWTPELSENTKNAIWQYLQTLYILGNTISSLPENTLSMIEQIANQCAKDIDSGKLDTSALMSGMTNMFQKKM